MEYFLQKKTCSAIVDTQGGELISFRDSGGTEYIWNGDPAFWTKSGAKAPLPHRPDPK